MSYFVPSNAPKELLFDDYFLRKLTSAINNFNKIDPSLYFR